MTQTLPLQASYYAGRGRRTLVISRIEAGRRIILKEIAVIGMREARKVAAAEGAVCWNF